MERKIGEIFEYNGEWLQCVEQPEKYDKTVCAICDFHGIGNCELDECSGTCRSDKKSVIFKKLEKVGEPYEFDGHLFQSYYTLAVPIFTENYATVRELGNNSKISIEIKQNKEDMKEKEQCGDNRFEVIEKAKKHLLSYTNIESSKEEMKVLDNFLIRCWQMGWLDKYNDTKHSNSEKIGKNLKPFDLEAAKAGKPVCTRDGRNVRIIAFDAKRKDEKNIIALVPSKDYPGFEDLIAYPNNGNYHGGHENDGDLMMYPEKKEGCVNVYKERIYSTKEEAIEATYDGVTYVDTVKVCWEE